MPRNPKIQVEWQAEKTMWLIAGGKLEEPTVVSTVEIRAFQFSFKQWRIYRAVAFFLGFKERTQLPRGLEQAIKRTWSEPNEAFVGYTDG
ncbi:hypothetical protein R1sor_003869 [Riccia sorocarpa]|uniref:Uncharacterized protein n=1 Tax=Riccia sorocarpa TaxID=122646 RepID=A0ABD3H2W8_9MARC